MDGGQTALAAIAVGAAALLVAPPAAARPISEDPQPGTAPPAAARDQATIDAVDSEARRPRDSDVPASPPGAQTVPAPPAPPVDHEALEPQAVAPDSLDDALTPGRRRPGVPGAELEDKVVQVNPGAVGTPSLDDFPSVEVPISDRYRLISALCAQRDTFHAVDAVCRSKRDPYHQNPLKGDRPIKPEDVPLHLLRGDDWYLSLTGISDTIVEPRSFPTPVGVQTTARPGSLDVFGKASSLVLSQTFIVGADLFKGSTAFKPPEIEYKITLAYNRSYVDVNEKRILDVRPTHASHRSDAFLGVQDAFVDYHIRNTSDRYDFDSVRVGIQGFQADFRGFLFNDNQLGVRLFGDRDDNRFQYNLAAFWRLEKDTNSGLNDVTQKPRDDFLLFANLYRQDFPVPGFTSQLLFAHEFDREKDDIEIDKNGFPERPALLGDDRGRAFDVNYVGYNGDGHFNRINLTVSAYGAFGQDRKSIFTDKPADIRAFFLAAEPSYDIDWARFRLSALYASGDKKPYDNTETGFDAIFENPVFAGADTSYYIRQSIPFAGGGRVINLAQRNGILNDLRSSKEQGQSNFNNPGTMLLGAGSDFDITPTFRLSTNVNHLWFAHTQILQALRVEGSIPKSIGWDYSASTIWRPKMTQNIVFRLSGAVLRADAGLRDLFAQTSHGRNYYSVLANAIVAF